MLFKLCQGSGDIALVYLKERRQSILRDAGMATDVQEEKTLTGVDAVRCQHPVEIHEIVPVGCGNPFESYFQGRLRMFP